MVAVTSGGITINLIFDAAALAAPASFRAGIQQAVAILAAAISDKITVNIKIDYSGTGGGAAAGPDHGLYESYSSIRADLINNATPGDTTFNALAAGSSIQGQSNVAVWNAQLKLWGLMAPNDTTTDDGGATFATDINPNLLVGVALHELTHAMGRIPYGSSPDIFDFFRFTGAGTRLFQGGATAPAAYFSLDGGNMKLADYGRTSDPSDFLNSGVQGSNDPFNEFYNGATSQQLTAIDLKQLDALGFHLVASGAGVNHAPVVTVPNANVPATAGQVLQASSLFSASDADGDALTYYLFDAATDPLSGYFAVNGKIMPNGTIFAVNAAQLAQTTLVAGHAGITENLYVMAYDGQAYSGNTSFSAIHVNVDHAPVVTVPNANVAATAGQVLQASSLFSASDADGDALTYYLFDAATDPLSGYFAVNGKIMPNGTIFAVNAAQLAQTTLVAGHAGITENLYVMAYDGQAYSGNTSFSAIHVNVDHAPVVTVPNANVAATAGQVLQASSLFSASDADGDALTYYLFDAATDPLSGYFAVNGKIIPNGTVFAVNAAQLAQTTLVAGHAGITENLYVMAYDGQAYSGNTSFSAIHVNVTASQAQVLNIPDASERASAGQTASSLPGINDRLSAQPADDKGAPSIAANSEQFRFAGNASSNAVGLPDGQSPGILDGVLHSTHEANPGAGASAGAEFAAHLAIGAAIATAVIPDLFGDTTVPHDLHPSAHLADYFMV